MSNYKFTAKTLFICLFALISGILIVNILLNSIIKYEAKSYVQKLDDLNTRLLSPVNCTGYIDNVYVINMQRIKMRSNYILEKSYLTIPAQYISTKYHYQRFNYLTNDPIEYYCYDKLSIKYNIMLDSKCKKYDYPECKYNWFWGNYTLSKRYWSLRNSINLGNLHNCMKKEHDIIYCVRKHDKIMLNYSNL